MTMVVSNHVNQDERKGLDSIDDNNGEYDEFVKIVIVGAGPTGLGAAVRLHEGRMTDEYVLLEGNEEAGGLACTLLTEEGFYFDLGGHVIFSHYQYFDDVLQHCVGDFTSTEHWSVHQRKSYIYITAEDQYIPYPFQLHFMQLANEHDKQKCLTGLQELQAQSSETEKVVPANFEEWSLASLGKGIHELFMKPYNEKVWAHSMSQLSWTWLSERVASVNLQQILQTQQSKQWGPNSTFVFPLKGGTGSIWKKVAQKAIPAEKQRYNVRVTSIDLQKQIVTLHDGKRIKYEAMMNTMPLDDTLRMVGRVDLANRLRYSSTHVIGIGIRGVPPSHLQTKCWLYFPNSEIPFYRCTIFSNYSKYNCPSKTTLLPTLFLAENYTKSTIGKSVEKPGPYYSLLLEIASSSFSNKKYENSDDTNNDAVIQDTLESAIRVHLLEKRNEIVSICYKKLQKGYPTPHLDRDGVLQEALPYLESYNIYNRGRFGSWKYEVANQDHSFLLGVEAMDHIFLKQDEITLFQPHKINGNHKGQKQIYKIFSSRPIH